MRRLPLHLPQEMLRKSRHQVHLQIQYRSMSLSYRSAFVVNVRVFLQEGDEEKINHRIPHRFEPLTNIGANWCCHCGYMLPLGRKNARKCSECDITCHANCAHLVPDFCGMSMETANQILSNWRDINRARGNKQQAANRQQTLPGSQYHSPTPSTDMAINQSMQQMKMTETPDYLGRQSPSLDGRPPDPRTQTQQPYSPQTPVAGARPGRVPPTYDQPPPARTSTYDQPPAEPYTKTPYQVNLTLFARSHISRHKQIPPVNSFPTKPTSPAPGQTRIPPAEIAPGPSQAVSLSPQQSRPPARKRKVGLDDFNFLAVLGKGNFGKVMLAEEKKTNALYAIKVLKKEFIIDNDEVERYLHINRTKLSLTPYLQHTIRKARLPNSSTGASSIPVRPPLLFPD